MITPSFSLIAKVLTQELRWERWASPPHRVALGLLLALLSTGCAVLQDRKAAVAYAYAGTAADFASTKIKLDEGCRESNPLLGQPNDATLAAVALGSLALVYAMDKNDSPVWAFWLLGTLHGGAAAYNMTVNCK